MDEKISSIEVVLHKPDIIEFLSEHRDPENAAEQYRAEYERRLREWYPGASIEVILGETNGMENYYYINGMREDHSSCDELAWIEEPMNKMVNDWNWLED